MRTVVDIIRFVVLSSKYCKLSMFISMELDNLTSVWWWSMNGLITLLVTIFIWTQIGVCLIFIHARGHRACPISGNGLVDIQFVKLFSSYQKISQLFTVQIFKF